MNTRISRLPGVVLLVAAVGCSNLFDNTAQKGGTSATGPSAPSNRTGPLRLTPGGPVPATLHWVDTEVGIRFAVRARVTVATPIHVEATSPLPKPKKYSTQAGWVEWTDPGTGEQVTTTVEITFADPRKPSPDRVDPKDVPARLSEFTPGRSGRSAVPSSPALAPDVEIPLPAPVGDVVVAGAGRYLLLSIPLEHKVAVFDVREAAVKTYVDTGAYDFLVAGGATRFVIVDREHQTITTRNLATFAQERQTVSPYRKGRPPAALMSPSGRGPLWLVGDLKVAEPIQLIRPEDFSLVQAAIPTEAPIEPPVYSDASISDAGDLICLPYPGAPLLYRFETGPITTVRCGVDLAQKNVSLLPEGGLLATPGGLTDFSGASRIQNSDGFGFGKGFAGPTSWFTFNTLGPIGLKQGRLPQADLVIRFHRNAEATPCAVLKIADIGDDAFLDEKTHKYDPRVPAFNRRVHYLPGEKTFAFVTRYPERIVLKRFDLEREIAAQAPGR